MSPPACEGLIIPGYWLTLLGIPDVPDWPIVANEKYIVAGTAVRFLAWHQDANQLAKSQGSPTDAQKGPKR